MSGIFKLSSAGGVTSKQRYPNMLTNYGDFGALQRIASAVISGSSTNVFSPTNIPQTYQDLMLVIYSRSAYSATTAQYYLYLNNDASAIYSRTRLYGNGSGASSDRTTNDGLAIVGELPAATSTSGIFGSSVSHILNYTNNSTYKTVLARSACDLNGSGFTHLYVNTYRSTSPITAFSLFNTNGSNFAAGTVIELFGVKASAS